MDDDQITHPKSTISEEELIALLRTCYDPEIPMNIYDLGLIYSVKIGEDNSVDIDMTLTSPACPAIQSLPDEIKARIEIELGAPSVNINLVWDPPYDQSMMSEEARLVLGYL